MTDLLFWDADLLSGAPAGVVTADCVTSWEPEKTAEVTSHPIETGSEVSDHVITVRTRSLSNLLRASLRFEMTNSSGKKSKTKSGRASSVRRGCYS
jgi:hypothetical protein